MDLDLNARKGVMLRKLKVQIGSIIKRVYRAPYSFANAMDDNDTQSPQKRPPKIVSEPKI